MASAQAPDPEWEVDLNEHRPTHAKVFDDGKLFIEQDDGSWCEGESQTDLAAVAAFTEEEILRQAEEDGTLDIDFENGRLVFYPADEKPKAAVGDE